MKTISIIQPRGLGDIFFTQKIAKKLIEHNFKVNWFTDTYFWLKDYIKVKDLNFYNDNIGSDYKLQLNNSIEENHPYDIMTSKYSMIGKTLKFLPESLHKINFNNWVEYFTFERNVEKEKKLFHEVLGLNENSSYILYNSKFGISQINHSVEKYANGIQTKKIDLMILNDFTLLDWCKVIENAEEIHTVDTSIIYLVEKLSLKAKKIKIYPRHSEHTKKCLQNILHKGWEWN